MHPSVCHLPSVHSLSVICLSVCLCPLSFICPSVCLFLPLSVISVHLSVCVSLCLSSVCLFVPPSVCHLCPSVCLCLPLSVICLSVCASLCLSSFCPSVCLYICPSLLQIQSLDLTKFGDLVLEVSNYKAKFLFHVTLRS